MERASPPCGECFLYARKMLRWGATSRHGRQSRTGRGDSAADLLRTDFCKDKATLLKAGLWGYKGDLLGAAT